MPFIERLCESIVPAAPAPQCLELIDDNDADNNNNAVVLIAPSMPGQTIDDNDDRVTETPAKPPDKKMRNIHEWNNCMFSCQGHDFDFDLPHSHVIVPSSHCTSLENDHDPFKQF